MNFNFKFECFKILKFWRLKFKILWKIVFVRRRLRTPSGAKVGRGILPWDPTVAEWSRPADAPPRRHTRHVEKPLLARCDTRRHLARCAMLVAHGCAWLRPGPAWAGSVGLRDLAQRGSVDITGSVVFGGEFFATAYNVLAL